MNQDGRHLSRRDFGKATVALGGLMSSAARFGSLSNGFTLPLRDLGKTGLKVSILGLGTAPLGAPDVSEEEAGRVIDVALKRGVNYIDTAPIYRMAERRLGVALEGRREKFILVSKVEAISKQDAIWQVRESLLKLKTDYLDGVHLHNVGRTDRFPDMDALLSKDGALEGLRTLKKDGVIKHIGLTTHLRPTREMPILETGHIEFVMSVANFVDRHTYNFEGTIFDVAKKRGLGIVAMKILGGPKGKGARLSAEEHYQDAVRYALSLPGLSVALMGVKTAAEFDLAADTFLAYKPFSKVELARVEEKGRKMAAEWGELRGPVALA